VALGFLYRLARRVVEFLRIHRMDDVAKDAEILRVGCRQNPCDMGWGGSQHRHFPRYWSRFPIALVTGAATGARWSR
jgi:hypothetical protein